MSHEDEKAGSPEAAGREARPLEPDDGVAAGATPEDAVRLGEARARETSDADGAAGQKPSDRQAPASDGEATAVLSGVEPAGTDESAVPDGGATAEAPAGGRAAGTRDAAGVTGKSLEGPSSSSPGASRQKARSAVSRAKVLLAALAAVLIAICGWSAVQYRQGRDPLSALFGDQALVTTDEAGGQDGDAQGGPDAAAQNGQDAAAADAGESGQQDGGQDQDQDASSDAGAPQGSSTASSDASGGASPDASAQAETTPQQPSGTSASQPQTESSAPQPAQPAPAASSSSGQQQSQDVRISVTVDGTAAGGSSRGYAVTVAPGSNAYDALVATGVPLNAEDTVYGTYVASIDGLAEKDHGSMSGWVYAVNGVEPNTAASNYQLKDGDTVVWTYVNVDY